MMKTRASNAVVDSVRRSLGRSGPVSLPARPAVPAPRPAGSTETELALLVEEINKLSGQARQMSPANLAERLVELVRAEEIHRAVTWDTVWLRELRLAEVLSACDVEVISPHAEKSVLATCDLGITSVDFALPETGTLGLLSGPDKPRAVSLLPRVHLALMEPAALRADLHQVFAEFSGHAPVGPIGAGAGNRAVDRYLILITGPSRTSDIELTVTLGVHGPRSLYVWIVNPDFSSEGISQDKT